VVVLAKTATAHLTDELIAQAVASIEAAEHFDFPFPRIFFRNFFPTDFYRYLVRNIPAGGYDPITGTGTRMALRLYGDDNVEKISPKLRSAWAAVSDMLTSKELETAIRMVRESNWRRERNWDRTFSVQPSMHARAKPMATSPKKLRRGDLNVLAEWIATYAPVASELVAIATVAFKSQRERDAEQPVRSVCPCY
jgi:hypothetical protein